MQATVAQRVYIRAGHRAGCGRPAQHCAGAKSMDKTMVEVEQRRQGNACPACGAGRVDDVGPCAACGRRTADPQIQRRPTKKERRTARAEDVLDLASKYARTHRDALTRGEALRFLGDHVAELPNVSLLRRGAAYALAASRAAPAEFYGGDGTPQIAKGEAVPECLARTVRRLCDGGHILRGKANIWTEANQSLGAALQWLASYDTATVGDDRGKYALDTLLKLWACLPEAVAREATKNAIDDCHEAVRKLHKQRSDLEGALAGAFGDKGDAAADVGALEACLAQAEALADEISKEDPKKGVYRKRLDDLAQHRRAAAAAAAACEDALGDAGDALARYKHPTDAALDRWTAHRAAEKRLRACGARRRALGERARALHARAKEPERRGLDIDALTRRVLDGVGAYDAMAASPRLDVVSLIRRIREGEAQLPPAPAEPAEPVEPEATRTPRDPQLYDYAAARVACEEADAALAARVAKTARQRLRIMRAAALAGALPATVDPDAAATVAHLSDRLAGRRRVAERPWEQWAARAPPLDAAALAQLRARARRPRRGRRGVGRRGRRGRRLARGARRQHGARGRRGPGARARRLRGAAAAAGRRRRAPSTSSPAAARPRPTCSSPRGGRGRGAARRRRPPAARQDRRAGRRHGRRGPARRRPRARAALCRAEAAVPERVDATLPEAAAPPPAEADRAPRPRRWRGDAGAVQGRHARFRGKVPPRRLPAVLRRRPRGRPRRPVRARVPGSHRPAGRRRGEAAAPRAEGDPARARRRDRRRRGRGAGRAPEHGGGRGAGAAGPQRAGDRRGAQRREPRHGAPGPRRPARAARLRRPDGGGRRARRRARVARAVRFGAGDDAAPALDFGREQGPVRRVDWDVYVAGAARTRTAQRPTTWARAKLYLMTARRCPSKTATCAPAARPWTCTSRSARSSKISACRRSRARWSTSSRRSSCWAFGTRAENSSARRRRRSAAR